MDALAPDPVPQPPDQAAEPAGRPPYRVEKLRQLRPPQLIIEPLERRYWWAGFTTTTPKR
jgi:hypothetical protein